MTGAGSDRRHRPALGVRCGRRSRRTGFRRAGEGHHAYVDGLAWRIVGLAVLVYVSSLLDALLTLLYLEDGGGEANPVMHLALAYGPTVFVALKLSITGVAVWWLRSPSAVAARRAVPLRTCAHVWGGARLSSRALFTVGVAADSRQVKGRP